MKKSGNIIQWIFGIIIALCAISNGFHYTSILIALSAVLLMPIPKIREFLNNKLKLKNGLIIALSVLLLFTGVGLSPVSKQETVPKTAESHISSSSAKSKSEVSSKSESVQSPVGTGKAEKVSLSEIPQYSGSAYITINNNTPNFLAEELSQKGILKFSELDTLGRCGAAFGICGKETMPKKSEVRKSISEIKPTGWLQKKYSGISGGYLWNRCHLIGWQLSAENANKKNLITGTRYMNTEGMLPFENMTADYIKETRNHVAYRVTPIFDGENLVCSGVLMEAYSIEDKGDGICFSVFIYNIQPNININYLTGDSSSADSQEQKPSEVSSAPASSAAPAVSAPSEPAVTPAPPIQQGNTDKVWITDSGKKFHSRQGCSNMKAPYLISRAEAESRGYEACKKCY